MSPNRSQLTASDTKIAAPLCPVCPLVLVLDAQAASSLLLPAAHQTSAARAAAARHGALALVASGLPLCSTAGTERELAATTVCGQEEDDGRERRERRSDEDGALSSRPTSAAAMRPRREAAAAATAGHTRPSTAPAALP